MPGGQVERCGQAPPVDAVQEFMKGVLKEQGVGEEQARVFGGKDGKEGMLYWAVADISTYVKQSQELKSEKMAALTIQVGSEAYLVWFRALPSGVHSYTWPNGDVQDAFNLAHFARDVLALATGQTLSNEVLVRVHDRGLRSRDEVHSMAHQLTSILASAHAPIFSVDKNKRVVLWNDEMERLTNVSKASACGRQISTFMPAKDDAVLTRAIGVLLRNSGGSVRHSSEPFELQFCRMINGELDLNDLIDLMLDANISTLTAEGSSGASTITFVGQDVTAAKKVLLACQTVADEHEKLISECGVPVFFVDSKGVVTGWNDTMAQVTGIRRPAAMGLQLADELFGGKLELTVRPSAEMTKALRDQHAQVMAGGVDAIHNPRFSHA